MKKVLGVAAFAVLGMVALSSCKKDYACKYNVGGVEVESGTCTGCTKSQKDAFETTCKAGGGTLVTK